MFRHVSSSGIVLFYRTKYWKRTLRDVFFFFFLSFNPLVDPNGTYNKEKKSGLVAVPEKCDKIIIITISLLKNRTGRKTTGPARLPYCVRRRRRRIITGHPMAARVGGGGGAVWNGGPPSVAVTWRSLSADRHNARTARYTGQCARARRDQSPPWTRCRLFVRATVRITNQILCESVRARG